MADPVPDPNNPQPTPGNPNPEPARPPLAPETPRPDTPPGVPPPTPDPVPAPEEEPVQIPPGTPPEIPSQPGFPAPTAMRANPLVSKTARKWLSAAFVAFVGFSSPVAAQSPETHDQPQTIDPCQAEPEDKEDEAGKNEKDQSPDSQLSAEMLDRCNGVLSPPPTGDREIEEPPADTGTTPVIPPGTVPQQPPG